MPPNFLVGKGATEFAYLHGLPIVENDSLVSATAKSRWLRWQQEVDTIKQQQELQAATRPPEHVAIRMESDAGSTSFSTTINPAILLSPPSSLHATISTKEQNNHVVRGIDQVEKTSVPTDGAQFNNDEMPIRMHSETKIGTSRHDDKDTITDTIGAIAIDCYGRIAAGSSSGGIGMKHPGRVGPAALVGIGTAVIPEDPQDSEKTSVATVTSGTGEHIATTLAASTCASRIYFSDRKNEAGVTENVPEEQAIKSMIDMDFMGKHSRLLSSKPLLQFPPMKKKLIMLF